MKKWIATALLGSAAVAYAQPSPPAPAAAPAPAASAPAPLPTSPAKKELVKRILVLQKQDIETLAIQLLERPAAQMAQQAGQVLQTEVPADKREAAANDIRAALKAYADEIEPVGRDRANRLAPTTFGTAFEQRFTEDELKAIIAWQENPVSRKYQATINEIPQTFSNALASDAGPIVEPKLGALNAKIRVALGLPPQGAAPAGSAPAPAAAAKPAAKSSTKPAPKAGSGSK